MGISNLSENEVSLEAYPNPAQNTVNVEISGIQDVKGKIQIIDALGRVVSVTLCSSSLQQIDVKNLANGVYTILFVDEAHPGNKLTTRLLIAK